MAELKDSGWFQVPAKGHVRYAYAYKGEVVLQITTDLQSYGRLWYYDIDPDHDLPGHDRPTSITSSVYDLPLESAQQEALEHLRKWIIGEDGFIINVHNAVVRDLKKEKTDE